MTDSLFEPNSPPPPDAPLAYASPPPARPGLITALGICSIVIGSLSTLASLCGGLGSVSYLVMSNMQVSTFTGSQTTVTINGATTTYSTTNPATLPNVPMMPFHVSVPGSIVSLIGEVLSLLVGIYLIGAGAAVLRDKLGAQRMHWRYVWLKIPAVLITAVGTWWMSHDMMQSIAAMQNGGPAVFSGAGATWMALIQAGFSVAFSMLYPIALIVALNTRPVKNYFNGDRAT